VDGRDAHPTITIKIVSYLIRDPKQYRFDGNIARLFPAVLYKKYKTASGAANFKIFEFLFWKQVYF